MCMLSMNVQHISKVLCIKAILANWSTHAGPANAQVRKRATLLEPLAVPTRYMTENQTY